ncbi:hypothetical protein [Streptomyces sp. NPDC047990]|uniref:putative phage holin n=1 Tax=Streptomyces sp. NPDC047990 TaxID=3365496 RepID=UPI00371D8631
MGVGQWVNVAGAALAAVVCAAFVITHHVKTTSWRSETGRNLTGFPAAVGVLFLYTVLVSFWPDGCFAMVMRRVRTLLTLSISGLIVQRIRILLKAQRES